MASRRHVRYTPLDAEERDEAGGRRGKEEDLRFVYTPKSFDKIPWKSICLALVLLSLGSLLLFLSLFIFTGHMGGDRSQAFGLLALGIVSFLPGMQFLNPFSLSLSLYLNFWLVLYNWGLWGRCGCLCTESVSADRVL